MNVSPLSANAINNQKLQGQTKAKKINFGSENPTPSTENKLTKELDGKAELAKAQVSFQGNQQDSRLSTTTINSSNGSKLVIERKGDYVKQTFNKPDGGQTISSCSEQDISGDKYETFIFANVDADGSLNREIVDLKNGEVIGRIEQTEDADEN